MSKYVVQFRKGSDTPADMKLVMANNVTDAYLQVYMTLPSDVHICGLFEILSGEVTPCDPCFA